MIVRGPLVLAVLSLPAERLRRLKLVFGQKIDIGESGLRVGEVRHRRLRHHRAVIVIVMVVIGRAAA